MFAFSLNYDVLQFLLSATSRCSDKAEGLVSEGTRFNSAQGEEITSPNGLFTTACGSHHLSVHRTRGSTFLVVEAVGA